MEMRHDLSAFLAGIDNEAITAFGNTFRAGQIISDVEDIRDYAKIIASDLRQIAEMYDRSYYDVHRSLGLDIPKGDYLAVLE